MRRILAVLMAALVTASLCACSVFNTTKTTTDPKEISNYIKDLTGADIGSYFAECEMEIKKENSEEYAKARIRLTENSIEKVDEILSMHIGKEEGGVSTIFGYQDHPYAVEVKKMNVATHFQMFTSGNKVKTRDINIYLAQDGDDWYFFMFA